MTSTPTSDSPVFLVGAHRSGSTMLRLMIGRHPEISFYGECEFAVPRVTDDGQFPDLKTYYDFLSTFRAFPDWQVEIDKSLSYPDLCHSFLLQRRDRKGTKLFGTTVHSNFHRLKHIWPNARYIHLLRDGRDVAKSRIGHGWAGNVWCAAPAWEWTESLWDQVAAGISEDRYIELKYEEILKDPEKELTRICAFFGVPYHPEMMNFPSTSTYGKPDFKYAYQWKRWKSDYDVQLAESQIGDRLVARGYELSGLPAIEVSPKEAKRLKRQDKKARLKFRSDRYGWPLLATQYFTRKLGLRCLRGLEKKVKLRMNEISREALR